MEENGFELVTKHHRLCSKKRYHDRPQFSPRTLITPLIKSSNEIYDRIQGLKNEEVTLDYVSSLKDLFNASNHTGITEVVCYGIGRVSEDITAQYQLAVLLGLADKLTIGPVSVYDPVLNSEEKMAIEKLGIKLIQMNELCRRPASVPTLFFMVHCGKAMYNNLLYSNWSVPQLANVIIIGNSFSSYYLRLTEKQLMNEAYYLLKIKGVFEEVPLPLFTVPNVFNDTAVHAFPPDKLQLLHCEVWRSQPEPYLDTNDEEMRI